MPPHSLHAPFLLALLSLLSAPEMASATEPELPPAYKFDPKRGGGLPHCQCDAYHNGAWLLMSRMCEYEWSGSTICYPTMIAGDPAAGDHSQGSVLNGQYHENSCNRGQTMCSPWTPPKPSPPPPAPPPPCTFETKDELQRALLQYLTGQKKDPDISLWVTRCITDMSVRRFVLSLGPLPHHSCLISRSMLAGRGARDGHLSGSVARSM